MANYNDWFMDEYRYALSDITYKKHPVVSLPMDVQSPELEIRDSLTIGPRSDSDVHVVFCRNVSFHPENIFSLTVQFDMVFEFKKSVDRNAIQDSEIIQLLQEEPFISEVVSKASLLISQITLIGSHAPMVLPPNFIVSVENE